MSAAFCPDHEAHTVAPEGYIQWHAWAETMSKTHHQRKCDGCGLFAIWEPKATPEDVAADLQEGRPMDDQMLANLSAASSDSPASEGITTEAIEARDGEGSAPHALPGVGK